MWLATTSQPYLYEGLYMNTKEKITQEALRLFSENGYKGTSVKQIADAVGIKDASLYKHFKSKQEIFDSIVEFIGQNMNSLSQKLGLHGFDENNSSQLEFYSAISDENVISISKAALRFYLTDENMIKFWRIAHMEQYSNKEIYSLFQQIFINQALEFQTELFRRMIENEVFISADPRAMAMNFYSPFFLLLTKYENQPDKTEEALELLELQLKEFIRIYKK